MVGEDGEGAEGGKGMGGMTLGTWHHAEPAVEIATLQDIPPEGSSVDEIQVPEQGETLGGSIIDPHVKFPPPVTLDGTLWQDLQLRDPPGRRQRVDRLLQATEQDENLDGVEGTDDMGIVARCTPESTRGVPTRQDLRNQFRPGQDVHSVQQVKGDQSPVDAVDSDVLREQGFQGICRQTIEILDESDVFFTQQQFV